MIGTKRFAGWTAAVLWLSAVSPAGLAGEPMETDPTKKPAPPPLPPPVEQKLTVYDLRRTDQPIGEVRVGRLRFGFADLFVLNEAQRAAVFSLQDRFREDSEKEVAEAIRRIKALREEYEKRLAELLPAPEAKAIAEMWKISEEYNEAKKKLDAERREVFASLAGMDAEKRRKTLDEFREKSAKFDEEMEKKLQDAMTEEQKERLKNVLERRQPVEPSFKPPAKPIPRPVGPEDRRPEGKLGDPGESNRQPEKKQDADQPTRPAGAERGPRQRPFVRDRPALDSAAAAATDAGSPDQKAADTRAPAGNRPGGEASAGGTGQEQQPVQVKEENKSKGDEATEGRR